MDQKALLNAGYRYALSLTHNRAEAEDLVQEAWFRLLRAHGDVEGRAILYTTIRNILIDKYRRSQLARFDPIDQVAEIAETDPALQQAVDAEALEGPLSTLRPEEREALYLQAVEGYSAREIAEMTERPRGTILSMLNRAKRKLLAALEAQDGDAREAGGGTA